MALPNRPEQPPGARGGEQPRPGITPAPAARPPAKPVVHRKGTPPPPIVAYEDLVAACGHPEKFGLFEDRLDKYRKDRRKKVTDRPCRACREKKRLEVEEAARVRQAERQQRAAEAAKTSTSPRKPEHNAGRLPDGAKFEVAYNAADEQWTGSLTVAGQAFTGSAGALFTLLNRLDRKYRQSLPPTPPEPTSPPG